MINKDLNSISNNLYDLELSQIITRAVSRIQTDMVHTVPFMAQQVIPWLQQLAGKAQPEDYFMHPLAFPALLLPWWIEQSLAQQPDTSFQADLVYSTINGYYYIRLIDNLMDDQATVELKLLPALNFFHTRFQGTYQPYFVAAHPFWDFFTTTWLHSANVTMQDAALTDIDETRFEQIAAQKTSAVKIPLVAVCYRRERPDLIESWSRLTDLLGCWHQMHNDLFDWRRDESRQTCTYFLSEGKRRCNPGESITAWVVREGFVWAIEKLGGWMYALKRLALELQSPGLITYLDIREGMLNRQQEKIVQGLHGLAKLAKLSKTDTYIDR